MPPRRRTGWRPRSRGSASAAPCDGPVASRRGDLEVLYQAAIALTCASRYEGTGIPVLEAMAAGCAVIASDSTGLVETVGEAGLLVGPADVDGWATAMDRLLTDPARRAELVAAGRQAVRHYDWAASADALAAAYRTVAAAS